MQKPIFIRNWNLKLLFVAIFLLFAGWRSFAQPKTAVTLKDAKTEDRYLESADGSMRVVRALASVDGQYCECNGEGPKSLGPLEKLKGSASCPPTPPGLKLGQLSFDIIMARGDSLIIHIQPGNQLNLRQFQLKGGGQIKVPSTMMATQHGGDRVMLKPS
jgi:hypothetical protein